MQFKPKILLPVATRKSPYPIVYLHKANNIIHWAIPALKGKKIKNELQNPPTAPAGLTIWHLEFPS